MKLSIIFKTRPTLVLGERKRSQVVSSRKEIKETLPLQMTNLQI